MNEYSYEEATSRNIGILTRAEQDKLGSIRVAVPGVGGLGGTQVMIMSRLGIRKFNLADFDKYDVTNLNRQYGATVDTIGKPKIEIMTDHIKSIHPGAEVKIFEKGLHKDNVIEFVSDADIVLDAIDLTAMSVRETLYEEARAQGKYVIACGPVGYGFFCLVFDPQGPSYQDVFGTRDSMTEVEKMKKFLASITPEYIHASYMDESLVKPTINAIEDVRFSWISPAIFMAAGNGIAELIKIVLQKGKVICVPDVYQYDAFVNQMTIGRISHSG